jgi:hypothetical protein
MDAVTTPHGMVFHHIVNTQLLDNDMVIVVGIRLCHLVVKITALTGDLEMRFRHVLL